MCRAEKAGCARLVLCNGCSRVGWTSGSQKPQLKRITNLGPKARVRKRGRMRGQRVEARSESAKVKLLWWLRTSKPRQWAASFVMALIGHVIAQNVRSYLPWLRTAPRAKMML